MQAPKQRCLRFALLCQQGAGTDRCRAGAFHSPCQPARRCRNPLVVLVVPQLPKRARVKWRLRRSDKKQAATVLRRPQRLATRRRRRVQCEWRQYRAGCLSTTSHGWSSSDASGRVKLRCVIARHTWMYRGAQCAVAVSSGSAEQRIRALLQYNRENLFVHSPKALPATPQHLRR